MRLSGEQGTVGMSPIWVMNPLRKPSIFFLNQLVGIRSTGFR